MSYRIGIIGVGSIGSVVGGMLTKAGHDVTLIDQWPDHVDAAGVGDDVRPSRQIFPRGQTRSRWNP